MILSLVAEGRTVVLSSHLLDEVERTCDAVAIVDRGKVIRQGAITDLLAGSSFVVEIECSEPSTGRRTARGHLHRRAGRDRAPRPRDHPAGGDRTRRHRRDQPRPGGRRHLGLPAPGGADLARVVVPAGHQPTGGVRMTTTTDATAPVPAPIRLDHSPDRRGSWIPTGGMISHPVHGAAQAAGPHDRPDPRHHRHPHPLPRHPPPGPRLRPEVLRSGRRVGHLQRPGGRRALCLRLHRGRHLGLHGRIRRPHRGDVPPSGRDRPVAVGALPGPDTGRTGHRGTGGGRRVHHRVRGVCLRRTHPVQLRRGQHPRQDCPKPPLCTGPPTTRTR